MRRIRSVSCLAQTAAGMIVTSIERMRKTPEGRKRGKSAWKREREGGMKRGVQMLAPRKNRSGRLVGRINKVFALAKPKEELTTEPPRVVSEGEGCSQGP